MPVHDVRLLIQNELPLGITDVVFKVRANRRLVGTVRISRGAIDFTPRNGPRVRMNWDRFAELMQDAGRVTRRGPIPPTRRGSGR